MSRVRQAHRHAEDAAGYSGTPLPKKLGINDHTTVGLFGAPDGFERTLGKLPIGARLVKSPRSACDLVLCFAKSRAEMNLRMPKAIKRSSHSGLWLIWPKKSSGVVSDLSEEIVRTMGLEAGWVDFKVAAIDATWSGHRFATRRTR